MIFLLGLLHRNEHILPVLHCKCHMETMHYEVAALFFEADSIQLTAGRRPRHFPICPVGQFRTARLCQWRRQPCAEKAVDALSRNSSSSSSVFANCVAKEISNSMRIGRIQCAVAWLMTLRRKVLVLWTTSYLASSLHRLERGRDGNYIFCWFCYTNSSVYLNQADDSVRPLWPTSAAN